MRREITNIVNRLSAEYSIRKFDFDLHGCYNLIFNHCKETKTAPSKHEYSTDNGVLIIDGKYIERVATFV